jgi:hypothetical protein
VSHTVPTVRAGVIGTGTRVFLRSVVVVLLVLGVFIWSPSDEPRTAIRLDIEGYSVLEVQ